MQRIRLDLAVLAAILAVGVSSAIAGDDPAPAPKDPPKEQPKDPAVPPKPDEAPKAPEAPVAPAFTVKDIDGKDRTLAEFAGKWVVLEWVNPGCPYVKKFYTPGVMQALQQKYVEKGIVWLSVCSTNPAHKDYKTPEQWKAYVAEAKVGATAVLFDADGTVGKAYGALRTPEVRIVCPKGTLQYVGAVDDNKDPKADPTKARNYISEFLDAVLAGKTPEVASSPAYG
jgi:cytochrome oxidase Cu insertion factor (SCO1/SenC/PrrC family)